MFQRFGRQLKSYDERAPKFEGPEEQSLLKTTDHWRERYVMT